MKFNVGDRVRCVGFFPGIPTMERKIGTIIDDIGGIMYGVEFDRAIHGLHNCGGMGKDGHCFVLDYGDLEKIEEHSSKKTKN